MPRLPVAPRAGPGSFKNPTAIPVVPSAVEHRSETPSEAAQSFVDLIGVGVDRGFAEARDILDSLKVLQGDIATNIDKTYDLVQEGLKNFLDSFQTAESESQSGETDSNSSKD